MDVEGAGTIVRRNVVVDTGGSPGNDRAIGIEALGDVIDNVVDGISGANNVANFAPEGIYAGGVGGTEGPGLLVRGNRVRNLVPKGTSQATGIAVAGTGISVRENTIVQDTSTNGIGIYCSLQAIVANTIVRNYTNGGLSGCYDAGGNVVY